MDSSVVGRRARRAPSLPDEALLVAGLRSRDETVFAQVVDAWTPTMRQVARAHVATPEVADEVVQETWVAVIRGLDRFEGRSSLRTWVFHILTNIAKTVGVRERRTTPVGSLTEDDHGPTVSPDRFRDADDEYPGHWRSFPAPWPSPEAEAIRSEVRVVVAEVVAALPERQRLVITLRDMQGFASDEVCQLLSVSAANQRVLLHRARAQVRARLEEHFGRHARWGATT
jgi:RNA polymerase sigma-70 factor (ECF subfamily)